MDSWDLSLVAGGLMATPLYRQIAEDLRQRIESGELGPGDRLPSEFELREHYDVSRNTVRDASKWLIALGLVESRPGQGIVVATKIDPFVTTLSSDPATGLGGGEGTVYLSEANANHRKAFSSPVQVFPADRNQFIVHAGTVPAPHDQPEEPGS
jgi:DNA-binding transcriptional MocR family regulator